MVVCGNAPPLRHRRMADAHHDRRTRRRSASSGKRAASLALVAAELAEAYANLLAEKPGRERRAASWPRTRPVEEGFLDAPGLRGCVSVRLPLLVQPTVISPLWPSLTRWREAGRATAPTRGRIMPRRPGARSKVRDSQGARLVQLVVIARSPYPPPCRAPLPPTARP